MLARMLREPLLTKRAAASASAVRAAGAGACAHDSARPGGARRAAEDAGQRGRDHAVARRLHRPGPGAGRAAVGRLDEVEREVADRSADRDARREAEPDVPEVVANPVVEVHLGRLALRARLHVVERGLGEVAHLPTVAPGGERRGRPPTRRGSTARRSRPPPDRPAAGSCTRPPGRRRRASPRRARRPFGRRAATSRRCRARSAGRRSRPSRHRGRSRRRRRGEDWPRKPRRAPRPTPWSGKQSSSSISRRSPAASPAARLRPPRPRFSPAPEAARARRSREVSAVPSLEPLSTTRISPTGCSSNRSSTGLSASLRLRVMMTAETVGLASRAWRRRVYARTIFVMRLEVASAARTRLSRGRRRPAAAGPPSGCSCARRTYGGRSRSCGRWGYRLVSFGELARLASASEAAGHAALMFDDGLVDNASARTAARGGGRARDRLRRLGLARPSASNGAVDEDHERGRARRAARHRRRDRSPHGLASGSQHALVRGCPGGARGQQDASSKPCSASPSR